MKTVIVIPAYNEARTIADVVRAAVLVSDAVIVINDGSNDDTGRLAARAGAVVYHHLMNRGLGAAIGTGFAAALRLGAECIVTMDADGQHPADCVAALTEPIGSGTADVVIGSRRADHARMPLRRRAGNIAGNVVTRMLFGVRTTDSQSGLRALSARAVNAMRLRGDRMEVSSEILAEVRRLGLRYAEVPIAAIYTEYSLSKGQGVREGVRTLARLIARRIFG